MNLLVSCERRYVRTNDGRLWTGWTDDYSFWTRYLDVFDQVRVLSRVDDQAAAPDGWMPVLGDSVVSAPLPLFHGPSQFVRRLRPIWRRVVRELDSADAIILRVPAHISALEWLSLKKRGRPFGVEVVGDPQEAYTRGAIDHPLRPFFGKTFSWLLERQCKGACAVAYVSAGTLQRRYPPGRESFATEYSSIIMPPEAYVPHPRSGQLPRSGMKLISIGSMDQPYKGFDVLIEALAKCNGEGLDAELTLVGDGVHRPALAALAQSLGVDGQVHFAGTVPGGSAVRELLDRSDIFALMSRTEGLPRALIEAMARALPCIGSTAGGIPELLEPDCLAERGSVRETAQRIVEFARANAATIEDRSSRNLETAGNYSDDVLRARRRTFYEEVASVAEEWSSSRSR